MIFKKLPELENCCCCFSLKWGSVALGVFFLLEGCRVVLFRILLSPQDKVCHDGIRHEECPLKEAWTCFLYTTFLLKCLIFFPAAILIAGILINNRGLITAFMYCVTVGEILLFLVTAFVFLAAIAVPVCGIKDEQDVAFCTIFGFTRLIICGYVLVVVKSYRSAIDRRRRRLVVRISDAHDTGLPSPPSPPESLEKKTSLTEVEDDLARKPSLKKVKPPSSRKLELGFEDKTEESEK